MNDPEQRTEFVTHSVLHQSDKGRQYCAVSNYRKQYSHQDVRAWRAGKSMKTLQGSGLSFQALSR